MKSTVSRKLKMAAVLLLALCFVLPFAPAFAAENAKTVRVGWFVHEGAQEIEDGQYSGYDYDYLMEIAKYTGWTYEFVEADFNTCTEMLKNGELDIIGSLFKTPERELVFDFPQMGYGNTYTSMFTRQDGSIRPYSFDSFDGINVGVVSNAVNKDYLAEFARDNGFTYMTTEFSGVSELISAVKAGIVDAGILGGYAPTKDTCVIAEFAPMPCYFVSTKGNSDILIGLNRAQTMIRIANPTIESELYEKHFGTIRTLDPTEAELAVVERSKSEPVTVGIIQSSRPLCYWDEKTNSYAGAQMELLKMICEKTGLCCEFVMLDITQHTPVEWLKLRYVDVVAGMLRTHNFESDRELVLSDDLSSDGLIAAGRKNEDFSAGPSEKTIALQAGFQVSQEYVEENFPEHSVIYYNSIEDCMDAVAKGEADATVYLRTCLNYQLQNPHYKKIELIEAYSEDVSTCIVGLSADNTTLIELINKGLGMISENERNAVMMNFTILNPYKLTLSDLIYENRILLIAVAVLILAIAAVLAALERNRKKNEKMLQEAYEHERSSHVRMKVALSVAEKASAAKGSFMSRMSHEIRTPLNAVIGYNMIARNELTAAKNDADRRQADMKVLDCLTKCEMASKHLLTVINDVLDMSAIESGRITVANERFDFKSMLTSLTSIFYSQAKSKGVQFDVHFDTLTEEWFIGDQMRVNQILTNLLSNAIKFTPAGGSVGLRICQPDAAKNAAHIRFEVADTGIGMEPEYLEHLWTPFEQADSSISRRYGGTGLGLSITKNLVDLMEGSIDVESKPEEGTTFTVDLTFERTEQPQKVDTYDFESVNALVVDDDASTCDYARLLFSRCGARCETATSGETAIAAFKAAKERGERFTVCMVDWQMPGMDGVETIRRIREITGEDIPIIILTAYDFSEIGEAARSAGTSMFLSKPLFQSSLFDLLVNISGKQSAAKLHVSTEYDFAGARVLLAEDNAMNMEVARRVLSSVNLNVDGAVNGKEAVRMLCESPAGTYKAILMDVQMPEMDGHAATRAIRASTHPQARSIPIIAMTADAFAENVAEAISAGMNGHISKPIDTQKLFEMLGSHIPNVKKTELDLPHNA